MKLVQTKEDLKSQGQQDSAHCENIKQEHERAIKKFTRMLAHEENMTKAAQMF